jgi:3-methylfumaryl-CoA hydratase
MNAQIPIDIKELSSYIGRVERNLDVLTERQCRALRTTLGYSDDGPVPLSVHWCLAPAIVSQAELSEDGMPKRGRFLPPVPLPRRMWASGSLEFLDTLREGDKVEKISQVADVSVKQGSSGMLCFVRVNHQILTDRGLVLAEQQDIVFRQPVTPGSQDPEPPSTAAAVFAPAKRVLEADRVMLFRYSALTFNSHRIHYDRPYATDIEGYPGLVVHGPLQASLLLELAAEQRGGRHPRKFQFRSMKPLFEGPISLHAQEQEGAVRLWTAGPDHQPAMAAVATW